MKNLKIVLKDIWINYWILLAGIYPIFAFLFWTEREDLKESPDLALFMILIAFGGVFYIIGYGIWKLIKLKKND